MRLIDADVFLEEMMKTDRYFSVRFDIEEQPTVDAAPVVHGHWEQCFKDWQGQVAGDRCSICGFEHYGNFVAHYHYCPNCGAKMDGGIWRLFEYETAKERLDGRKKFYL